MIDLLVLFALLKRDLTMYAVHKFIECEFSAYTRPSFGAIKPALRRLESNGFITSRKMMSDGGKLSVFYSVTKDGQKELNKLILSDLSENPLQFMSDSRVKLSCASYLSQDERKQLFFDIKSVTMSHKIRTENIMNNEYNQLSFYQRIMLDNALCEYNNFISIIEGFEKDNGSNSK